MKYHSISLLLVTTIFTLTTCTPTDVIDHLGNLSPFHEPQLNTGLVGGLGTGLRTRRSLFIWRYALAPRSMTFLPECISPAAIDC